MTQAAILSSLGSSGVSTGFKNKIINGAMVVAQRGTSSVNSHASYPVDRWQITNQMDSGVFTAQQSSDTPSGVFTNSIVCTVTTAQASIGTTSNYASIRQKIEGYNMQGFGQGTSAATSMTLSFWVKASQTGTWCVQLTNNDVLYYLATYTITSANTWQQITITVPPITTGTWNTTNGIGLQLWWTLAAGTYFQTSTANAWQSSASSVMKTSAQNNFFATNGNTFYITGVQLEVGSTATNFEVRDYGNELRMCQRYYETLGFGCIALAESGSTYVMNLPFKVTKRTQASVGLFVTSNIRVRQFGISDRDASSPSVGSTAGSSNGCYIKVSGFNAIGSAATAAGIGYTTTSENGDAFYASAEL